MTSALRCGAPTHHATPRARLHICVCVNSHDDSGKGPNGMTAPHPTSTTCTCSHSWLPGLRGRVSTRSLKVDTFRKGAVRILIYSRANAKRCLGLVRGDGRGRVQRLGVRACVRACHQLTFHAPSGVSLCVCVCVRVEMLHLKQHCEIRALCGDCSELLWCELQRASCPSISARETPHPTPPHPPPRFIGHGLLESVTHKAGPPCGHR